MIILHIGLPKTASTSIQNFLTINSKRIQKEGYSISNLLFDEGTSSNYGLYRNIVANVEKQHFESEYDKKKLKRRLLFDSVKYKKNIIYSCENFSFFSEESISYFKELFPKNSDFKIIVYLRRQEEYLESLTNQLIKWPSHNTSNLAIDDLKKYQVSQTHMLDYCFILKKWSQVFGDNNVKLRPFSRDFWFLNNVEYDFLYHIGFNEKVIEDLILPKRKNEAIQDRAVLEFLCFLNNSNIRLDYSMIEGLCSLELGSSIKKYPLFRKCERNNIRNQYKNKNMNLTNDENILKYFNEQGIEGSDLLFPGIKDIDLKKIVSFLELRNCAIIEDIKSQVMKIKTI